MLMICDMNACLTPRGVAGEERKVRHDEKKKFLYKLEVVIVCIV
jgi:hypothetical protein